MRTTDHGHHSSITPDSGLSSPAPSSSDGFSAVLPRLGVSAPCGPGSAPLSLPLWIPGHSLPGDVAGRLPEGVASPTLGLPLLLFPCGLQVRACLVMLLAGFLRVWPDQPLVFPSFSSPVDSRSEPAW